MATNSRQIALTFHGIGVPPDWVPVEEKKYWIPKQVFSEMILRVSKTARAHDIQLTVTFDDGNKSDVSIGAPLLRELGMTGYFFPCAGRLGKAGYLDQKDLETLISDGFEIGSHGMNHLPWATLHGDVLQQEIAGSKAALERAIGRPVRCAALPFGSYNRRALAAARAAGYQQVFSSDPGLVKAGSWFTRRISYHDGMTFDLPELVAKYSRSSRYFLGAAKHLVKALR